MSQIFPWHEHKSRSEYLPHSVLSKQRAQENDCAGVISGMIDSDLHGSMCLYAGSARWVWGPKLLKKNWMWSLDKVSKIYPINWAVLAGGADQKVETLEGWSSLWSLERSWRFLAWDGPPHAEKHSIKSDFYNSMDCWCFKTLWKWKRGCAFHVIKTLNKTLSSQM